MRRAECRLYVNAVIIYNNIGLIICNTWRGLCGQIVHVGLIDSPGCYRSAYFWSYPFLFFILSPTLLIFTIPCQLLSAR